MQSNDPAKPEMKLFKCECCAHGIEVDAWVDKKNPDGPYDTIDVNVWYMHAESNGAWRSRWQRIRAAWRVFRTGTLYLDTVMLKPETARQLGEELIKYADHGKDMAP